MSSTVWRTKRLVFRAPDPSDDDFLYRMSLDSKSFTQAAPFIPTPQGEACGKESREWIAKQFLGVLVCLGPDEPVAEGDVRDEDDPPEETDGKTDKPKAKKKTPKPRAIGQIMLMREDDKMAHHRHAEIGITMEEHYHGKGYGSEAIEWSLLWGFRFAGLHRISIRAFGFNTRAIALYRRIGFVDEGSKRQNLWFDGDWVDEVNLGMLEDEWRELYKKKQTPLPINPKP